MSLNIGTLIGYLELDDSKFAQKADRADRKINALKLHLQALARENPQISVEVEAQTAALDDLKKRLVDLKAQSASGVDVRVDAVQALIEIDRVQARIRELSKTATVKIEADTNPIDAKVDMLRVRLLALGRMNPKIAVAVTAQTTQLDYLTGKLAYLDALAETGVDVRVETETAMLELERVKMAVRDLHGKTITVDADTAPAERKLRSLNGLWTTILGLGPTLIPITGAAALGISAIGSAALGAAGAVGVLKAAFAGMGSAISAYGSYQSAVDKATGARRLALQQATTPSQRLTAQQGYTKSVQTANATLSASQYGQLGPQGQRFARFAGRQLAPGGAVFRLRSAAQASVLPGVMEGARAALPAVPALAHTERAIGNAVGGEVAAAGKALNNPFWQHFFTWLGREAPKDIKLFGSIFGNTIEGIIRYMERFAPDGRKLLHWVDEGAKAFNKWTAGKGFSQFMATLHDDAGAAGRALAPLVQMLPAITSGLSSAGVGELNTIGLILTAIAKLPTGVIEFLAQTLPIVILAVKAITIAEKLWAAAQAALNFVMDANPIMLVVLAIAALVIGFMYAYNHSEKFRAIVQGALHAVGEAGKWLWDKALHPAFDGIVAGLKILGKWGIWLWNNVFQPVFHFIVEGVAGVLKVWSAMVGALAHVPGFGWLHGLANDLSDASTKTQALANMINKIPTHKTSTIAIDVVRTVHGVVHGSGGHVAADPTAQHHATGGWSFGAGSRTSDSIMAYLSNGEFTVNAASAAANAPLLEAVNRSHGPLRNDNRGASGRTPLPSRMAITITNWDTGEGYMEDIADRSINAEHRHQTALAGMK